MVSVEHRLLLNKNYAFEKMRYVSHGILCYRDKIKIQNFILNALIIFLKLDGCMLEYTYKRQSYRKNVKH